MLVLANMDASQNLKKNLTNSQNETKEYSSNYICQILCNFSPISDFLIANIEESFINLVKKKKIIRFEKI